jgi:hypothetical protein
MSPLIYSRMLSQQAAFAYAFPRSSKPVLGSSRAACILSCNNADHPLCSGDCNTSFQFLPGPLQGGYCLTSRNSEMPYLDCSRPRPDSLMPPKGAAASVMRVCRSRRAADRVSVPNCALLGKDKPVLFDRRQSALAWSAAFGLAAACCSDVDRMLSCWQMHPHAWPAPRYSRSCRTPGPPPRATCAPGPVADVTRQVST